MISVSPSTWSRLGANRPVYPARAKPGTGHLGFRHLPVEPQLAGECLELERVAAAGEEVAESQHQRGLFGWGVRPGGRSETRST